MELKRIASKIAVGLATSGLTSCGVAHDAVPPPAACSSYDQGQGLRVMATLSGNLLTIQIWPAVKDYDPLGWVSASIPAVTGASLVNVSTTPSFVTVVLRLGPATEAGVQLDAGADATIRLDASTDAPADASPFTGVRGGFTLTGELAGNFSNSQSCALRRTFDFAITAGGITVSEALPLRAQQAAEIAVLEQKGGELLLESRTTFVGAHEAEWTVSGGEIVEASGNRIRWRLPACSGVHQVEVVLDFGDEGFAHDARRFTVG